MSEPTLYVTEGEIARRMGVGVKAGRKALQEMRQHPRFPPKNIGGKRYWPAVKVFLDFWNGLSIEVPGNQAGQETRNAEATPYQGRIGASVAAAKERLERRLAGKAGSGEGSRISSIYATDRHLYEHAD